MNSWPDNQITFGFFFQDNCLLLSENQSTIKETVSQISPDRQIARRLLRLLQLTFKSSTYCSRSSPGHPETHIQDLIRMHQTPSVTLDCCRVSTKNNRTQLLLRGLLPHVAEILVKICNGVKSQNAGINYPVIAATAHLLFTLRKQLYSF